MFAHTKYIVLCEVICIACDALFIKSGFRTRLHKDNSVSSN